VNVRSLPGDTVESIVQHITGVVHSVVYGSYCAFFAVCAEPDSTVRRGKADFSVGLLDSSEASLPAAPSAHRDLGYTAIAHAIVQVRAACSRRWLTAAQASATHGRPEPVITPALMVAATDGRFMTPVADAVFRYSHMRLSRVRASLPSACLKNILTFITG